MPIFIDLWLKLRFFCVLEMFNWIYIVQINQNDS